MSAIDRLIEYSRTTDANDAGPHRWKRDRLAMGAWRSGVLKNVKVEDVLQVVSTFEKRTEFVSSSSLSSVVFDEGLGYIFEGINRSLQLHDFIYFWYVETRGMSVSASERDDNSCYALLAASQYILGGSHRDEWTSWVNTQFSKGLDGEVILEMSKMTQYQELFILGHEFGHFLLHNDPGFRAKVFSLLVDSIERESPRFVENILFPETIYGVRHENYYRTTQDWAEIRNRLRIPDDSFFEEIACDVIGFSLLSLGCIDDIGDEDKRHVDDDYISYAALTTFSNLIVHLRLSTIDGSEADQLIDDSIKDISLRRSALNAFMRIPGFFERLTSLTTSTSYSYGELPQMGLHLSPVDSVYDEFIQNMLKFKKQLNYTFPRLLADNLPANSLFSRIYNAETFSWHVNPVEHERHLQALFSELNSTYEDRLLATTQAIATTFAECVIQATDGEQGS